MAKMITRTIVSTGMKLNTVGAEGLRFLDTHVEEGKLTDEQIVKLGAKLSKKNGFQVVITDVEVSEEKRAISLEDFIKNSHVVSAEEVIEEEDESTEDEQF